MNFLFYPALIYVYILVPDECEDVFITQCKGFTNQTIVRTDTNPFGFPNQNAVRNKLMVYLHLLPDLSCHDNLLHFLCTTFLPPCHHGHISR